MPAEVFFSILISETLSVFLAGAGLFAESAADFIGHGFAAEKGVRIARCCLSNIAWRLSGLRARAIRPLVLRQKPHHLPPLIRPDCFALFNGNLRKVSTS